MTKKSASQDLTFIIVKPRYPGNIGSIARAIKNMGYSRLVFVRPAILPTHPEARRLAVGAEPLLKKAKVVDTIEEAAKGLHFLVGTSRRSGKYRQDFVTLPELGSHLPHGQKIGILFGPEEKGLSNRDLAYCHLVTTIPSHPDFPSLNLAQSVVVVAYQLRLQSLSQHPARTSKDIELAPVTDIEGLFEHLERALTAINFFPHKNAFHMMRSIRQVFGRTALTPREVRIFRGVCRQILWVASRKGDS